MSATYNPPRQKKPIETDDPLEVALVYNVRPCGTCSFFWPDNPDDQSYGPYPMYDFMSNFPKGATPDGTPESYPWMKVKTRESGFPNGEVMDGCRKTPIMTIGINPNMTAFAPGRKGTSWTYPLFSDDDHTDGFAKYAYYYRYRNVYQERFDFETIKKYLLKATKVTVVKDITVTQDQILAAKDGRIVSAERPGAGPTFDLVIRYKGDKNDITITLQRDKGKPRYVLLFDREGASSEFKAGDTIAAKLDVPAGETLELYQELQTYYEQFVPSLHAFNDFLIRKGHKDANLAIGEDVGQLDMVACASPHWKPSFLGGTAASEQLIIDNCVSKNAWAMKQLVMTRPAVLFLVGESSFNMFKKSFGNLIHRDPPISDRPGDFAFTLFSETISSKHPAYFTYSTTIDGRAYSIKTRIIVTPHFSFSENFVPQLRLSKYRFEDDEKAFPECFAFLKNDKRIAFNKPKKYGYISFTWSAGDNASILETLEKTYADAWSKLKWDYYNPHQQMARVMEELYNEGALSYKDAEGKEKGYLTRTEGSCHFCVNAHWTFPEGCPYKKNEEEPPPSGFLDKVVSEIIEKGKPKAK